MRGLPSRRGGVEAGWSCGGRQRGCCGGVRASQSWPRKISSGRRMQELGAATRNCALRRGLLCMRAIATPTCNKGMHDRSRASSTPLQLLLGAIPCPAASGASQLLKAEGLHCSEACAVAVLGLFEQLPAPAASRCQRSGVPQPVQMAAMASTRAAELEPAKRCTDRSQHSTFVPSASTELPFNRTESLPAARLPGRLPGYLLPAAGHHGQQPRQRLLVAQRLRLEA